jgi:hypothetical protein
MFKTRYRVVTDRYLGFEAQEKHWWWPWWVQCGYRNTHPSIEKALEHVKRYKRYKSFVQKPVMYVE